MKNKKLYKPGKNVEAYHEEDDKWYPSIIVRVMKSGRLKVSNGEETWFVTKKQVKVKTSKTKQVKVKPLKITKECLDQINLDINFSLKKISEKWGLDIVTGELSFTDNSFIGNIKAFLTGTKTKEQRLYELKQKEENLPNIGSEVMIMFEKFKIVGYKLKSDKPIIIESLLTKKRFLITINSAKTSVLK